MAAKASHPQVKDLNRSFVEILLQIVAVVLVIAYWYAAIDAYRSGGSGDIKIVFVTIASMFYFFMMIPELIRLTSTTTSSRSPKKTLETSMSSGEFC